MKNKQYDKKYTPTLVKNTNNEYIITVVDIDLSSNKNHEDLKIFRIILQVYYQNNVFLL